MTKTIKRVISLLLAIVLVVGTFAGCGNSKKDEPPIAATAVRFSKSGQYTTKVSSKKVDLSGVTADNVEVRYLDLTADPEAESTETVTEEATTETTEEFKLEDVYPLSAKVESVKAADKKSCEITFTDDRASELITGSYIILFKGVEGDDNTADVAVEFPEITLTPDVENVVSDATQAKVTLAIDGSTFEDGISEKDIYLDNAFSDMKIESVSSSDKNLTVQLKGSPVRNEAGAYQWGAIKVKPSGIKDGYADVTSKIDIQLATVNMDTSTLKFENGKINADLKVYGIVDINTLTKDNIKIDGAAVEAAEKADDNTVKLTLSADGVKSVNDFADLIGGKAMKLGDYETTVSVSQASFYPVFDYVEADGDNLKLTLKLYASSGTFDKNIKADAISFADDFKDAKAESVTVDSDTVATLILSVPANGQTTENFKMNGTVTLAAGALTNAWGDKTSKETSFTRDYSGESLGKEVTLNEETLLEIQKYTEGLNTTFGKICHYGGIAGQVFSIGKSILEAAGVLESDQARLLRELAGINEKLDKISDQIYSVRKDIEGLVQRDIQNKLSGYNSDMELLNKKIRDVSYVYDRARKDLAKTDEAYANIDWENLTDEEASKYNHVLIEYILSNAKPDNLVYSSFIDDCNILKTKYESVTGMLERTGDNNPICLYDEACTYKYNFDSQAFAFRLAQRVYAETTLIKAYAALAIRYDAGVDPENPNAKTIIQDYDNAMKSLKSISNIGHPASELDAYIRLEEVEVDAEYISDIKLARDTKSAEAAKKLLTDEGYTVLDKDLNEGVSGYFTYLGYKTTDNYNDAIKDLTFSSGDAPVPMQRWNPTTKKNIPFTLVPYVGDDVFVAAQGGINAGLTENKRAWPIYIYYTKEELPGDNKAVVNLFTDNTYQGHENRAPFVLNPFGSEDIRLIYDRAEKPGKIKSLQPKGKNPEYYPYSYVLNAKIAFSDTTDLPDYRYFTSPIMAASGRFGRSWSEDETKEFISRMRNSTFSEELKAAGINSDLPLLLSVSTEKEKQYYRNQSYWLYSVYYGNVFEGKNSKITKIKLGVVHPDNPNRKESQYPNTIENHVLTTVLVD